MVMEEKNEEVVVAAIDVKVLHKRVGHLGKVGMERVAREGLVRGLEVGWLGKWKCARAVSCLVPDLILTDLLISRTDLLVLSRLSMLTWQDPFVCNPGGVRSICSYWSTTLAKNLG